MPGGRACTLQMFILIIIFHKLRQRFFLRFSLHAPLFTFKTVKNIHFVPHGYVVLVPLEFKAARKEHFPDCASRFVPVWLQSLNLQRSAASPISGNARSREDMSPYGFSSLRPGVSITIPPDAMKKSPPDVVVCLPRRSSVR